MHGRGRLGTTLPLLLAAAVLVALPGSAQAGWDGTQGVGLGDKISAEFGEGDMSVHEFHFYAPEGTTVDVKAKADAGLTLGFELWSDLGVEVDLTGATASGFKKVLIPADGTYILQVMADAGSGVYALTTKGKFPKKITVTGDDDEVHFGALKGSRVQGQVKSAKGSATKVKVAELTPVSNTYFFALTITGDGDVVTSIKVKAPKSKRSWGFGVMEVAAGTPVGFRNKWLSSPHNDSTADAFRHWDEDGEVEADCAKCHSSYGYQDWVGADGTAFESIEGPAALGSTVDCDACHNSGTEGLDTVLFPSGKRIDGLGNEARCMQCHQGRESADDMDTMIGLSELGDDDVATGTVGSGLDGEKDKLSFLNIHYLPAAATLYGRDAGGGYEYSDDEQLYNGRFYHVKSKDTCIECHDPHTTVLRLDDCLVCHPEATDYAGLRDIRMTRTLFDYDGDGDTDEGIAEELDGMAAKLYEAMQAYAAAKGNYIIYEGHSYPYFFYDTNENGDVDPGEAIYPNSYKSWTPNLVRAAYNYQYSQKDPGVYAHNARYVMELLYDSYMSLQGSGVYKALATMLVRNEEGGHFDATAEAYRHWDEDEELSTSCARCHGPDGFEFYVTYTDEDNEYEPIVEQPLPEGMRCESCHVDDADFAGTPDLREPAAVHFPSGMVLEAGDTADTSFLCLTCHQGRESGSTLEAMIDGSGLGTDEVATGTVPRGSSSATDKLSFRNIHYYPAGVTLYGDDAQGAYQYYGAAAYAGQWTHAEGEGGLTDGYQCATCHLSDHTFEPEATAGCAICHGSTDIETFKLSRYTDNGGYDGDAGTTTLHEEVNAFRALLYEAIREYADDATTGITYDGHSYPYWFEDDNGDDIPDEDSEGKKISYKTFTPRLVRACYNYQYATKEPGAWAHNTIYVLQVLYDTIENLEDYLGHSDYTDGSFAESNGLHVEPSRSEHPVE
jgi:hypothetical protein